MLKINLSILGVFLSLMQIYCQSFIIDSTKIYKQKTLSFEEANIINSYYHQEGIHSAITGGTGTEKLSDFANVIDLKLSSYSGRGIKKTYGIEMGLDYYTSASSDKIDAKVSSASSSDVRFYPTIHYRREDEKTGFVYGANISFSKEYDYTSRGFGGNLSKSSKSGNTEFAAKANIFLDTYSQIVASEFRTGLTGREGSKGNIGNAPRNTYDMSLTLSQVISKRLQIALTADVDYQSGLLSTPFHRVYLEGGSLVREVLPYKRFKIPVSLRANYFLGERFIIRSFYRYYKDDWGMNSHTVNVELPVKINPFFSVSPFYRYYKQNAIDYFAPYLENKASAPFVTSDYDLSGFTSRFYGVGIRHTPFKSISDLFAISQIELRGALYKRSDGLSASIVTFNIQFKGF
ncbi:MAG: DUF3570 domain-containing protein [Saprospiraceae bacterium]|jgi:hypothetical protein|nr:DUF3570 domain-containing protein [Saprospiraceae bacterium]